MLVIHGIWARDALCLWAEDSALPASLDAPAGGRSSRAPRPHPFAADPGVLGDALGLLGEGPRDLASKAAADELSLWLPSAGPGPGCAPELIRQADLDGDERADKRGAGRGRRAALGCWRVPVLAFDPAAALTLLAALDPVDSPPAAAAHPDLIAGGSAVYWAAVARFAADLCARGRILPVLGRAGDGAAAGVLLAAWVCWRPGSAGASPAGQCWVAAWRPVLTGPDAPRAAELAGAMPPVCRAGEPGGQPPGPLLAAALDALADAAARARLDASAAGPRGSAAPGRCRDAETAPHGLRHGPRSTVGPAPAAPRAPARPRPGRRALGGRADRPRCRGRGGQPRRTRRKWPSWPPPWTPGARPPRPRRAPCAPASGSWSRCCKIPCRKTPGSARDGQPSDPPDDTWHVEFTLQSAEDPSLMLAAADVWAGTGGWAPGGIARPDEELLLGLGSAARLFGELEDALRDPAPAGIALDTAGAFRFLKETGPLLAGAGFGVLLPDWARKARLGLKLTSRSQGTTSSASASAPNGSGFGLNDLVEFRYDLAVGDTTLDAEELAELAQLKIPLVRVRGQWVELDEGNLRAALKFMERGREGVMRAGDVLVAGLRGPEEDLEGHRGRGGRVAGRPALRGGRPLADPGRRPRPRSAATCAPTRSAAWPGCPSSATWAWAASWPTTWGWARACRRWRCWTTSGRRRAYPGAATHRPDAAGLPHVAGGELAAGSGAVHPGPGRARAPRLGPAVRRRPARRADRGGPGHHHLRAGRPGPRGAGRGALAPGGAATKRRTSRTRAPGRPARCVACPPGPGSR